MDEGRNWTMADLNLLRFRSDDRLPSYAYGYHCRCNYFTMYVQSIFRTNVNGT